MAQKKDDYSYLLCLYRRVDEFLNEDETDKRDLPEVVVSFGVVVERILKIKLYKKNPILVFDQSKLKEDSALATIALRKEGNIESTKIRNVIERFNIVFRKTFTDDEKQALLDIYEVRNQFIHGYQAENKIKYEPEHLENKMGTVWQKISKLATSVLGKDNIKTSEPKKKYTEQELQEVLIDEVRSKISQSSINRKMLWVGEDYSGITSTGWGGESCPRCGSLGFKPEAKTSDDVFSVVNNSQFYEGITNASNTLYKCNRCNLELTQREYDIAKNMLGR